ncbi:hypothetical protein [Actinopolymorpha singaporensis]|uniref:Uncharacterized protein n=1 Tax=Actinopolymorpha singaporensis TaxID=117157 RepID=A0A1H1R069_9ACTN|nr:hypothetical protein [Actinopolymorpha singaporensis]SDS28935.1 hypothetical protein SAMN04489717_2213 [Actinopolymorpha singaporensis]
MTGTHVDLSHRPPTHPPLYEAEAVTIPAVRAEPARPGLDSI